MEINKISINGTVYDLPAGLTTSDVNGLINTALYGNSTNSGNDSVVTNSTISTAISNYFSTPANKPSYAYSEIGYTVNPVTASSSTVSLAGTTPLHVVTFGTAISGVTLSTNPAEGHSCHVLFYNSASSDLTVDIAHDSTARICPQAANLSLTVKAGGYAEVDFLTANNKVYVRGV